MDMITYAKAKKYADKAVATGGNPELIGSLVTEEVTKVVAGADADFDTLKEVADWIKNDKTGAAKMQVDIGNLKTDLEHIELTPGPQGPQGDIGPQGPKGDPSKSAYEYAQDGGYAGTEEEFASDLHEAMNPVQVDWEQNNENAIDYIKNKPFGETNEFEYVPLVENLALATNTSGMLDKLPNIEYNNSYKIIVDEKEYFCEPVEAPFFGSSIPAIGNIAPINGGEWDSTQPPLYIGCFSNFWMFGTTKRENEDTTPYVVSVFKKQQVIKRLNLEYIQDIAGSQCHVQDFVYGDKTYNSYDGAEIFNSKDNVAIGFYSHAEGQKTIALGDCSHAEGTYCEAIGYGSHAEGFNAYAAGQSSHAEGSSTKATGSDSHAEGSGTEATYDNCHAEGWYTIANTPFLHVQGAWNIPEENPTLFGWICSNLGNQSYDGEKIVYIYNQRPSLNKTTGTITAGDTTEKTIKELKVGDYFSFTNNANSIIDSYLHASEFVGSEVNSETNSTSYTWIFYSYEDSPRNTQPGKYLHIVGNGTYSDRRSNAHTLEANGTAWYQGDVYVGSTSGVNRDEGSKKLATEDYVNSSISTAKNELLNGAGDAYDTLKELGELIDESQDAIEALETIAASKSNWEQYDETAPDFIKNKPFYDTGKFKWADLVINPSIKTAMFGHCYIVTPGAPLALDKEYKVVIDDKEYICSSRYVEYSDGFSGIAIGAETSGGLFLEPTTFKDTSIPFHIVNSGGHNLNAAFPNNQVPTNLQIYIKQADMKLLDRKFINYIPGERVSGKEIIYNEAKTTCGNGAEVFNNLDSNMAIGNYSHAEGLNTVAKGEGAHAEGFGNATDGNGAHAEGCYTKASNFAHSEGYMTSATGQGTHAEGTSTIASGMWSHAEGGYTETKGYYSHAEGRSTIAATINSHVQGMYNEIDTAQENKPIYDEVSLVGGGINSLTFDLNQIIYIITNPSLNCQTGLFYADSFTEIAAKDLKIDDTFVLNNANDFEEYYIVTSLENIDEKIKIAKDVRGSSTIASLGKYAHVVGNGFSNKARSNAHTLDWEGNAWYAGSVEGTSLILKSSTEGSNKRFRVTIDDNGELHTEEIVE